jgi:hypothetical protein
MATRRDGTQTEDAEDAARSQQAGGGPPPSPVLVPPSGEEENAAAEALTAAAVTTGAAPLAISFAAAGIMGAFDRFLRDRRPALEDEVMGLLETHAPELGTDTHAELVDNEIEAERAFAAGARARLDRDLPKALMIADPTLRETAVNAVLEREKRYARQREEAIAMRALGAGELEMALRESPLGAYWKLSPHVSEHTPDCLALGGKAWPPSVLRKTHPPTHFGCECSLVPIPRAISEGLMTRANVQSADQVMQALSMQETPYDLGEIEDERRLLEAYTLRYGKGTEKGGEFRPRRGGDPGRLLGLRAHRHRMPLAMANVPDGPRFEHREYEGGEHGIHDLHADKPYASFGTGEDAKAQAERSAHVLNEAHDAAEERKPKPPPERTPPKPVGDRITHEGVQALVGSKRPEAAGPVAHGFHFNPDLTRSEDREGTLHLAPGFWKLTREKRANVVHRHLGRQLAESLGLEGRKRLGDQAPEHLRSPKAISEHYAALNSPALRKRMAAMHPEALRLVAQAAHDHGFPLHPDARQHVAERPPIERPPEEHPAHALAKSLHGLNSGESMNQLVEAGYTHAGSELSDGGPTLVYRNHDAGASIYAMYSDGQQGPADTVFHTHVELDRPIAQGELHGQTLEDVTKRMSAMGHGASTYVGGWYEFVHPNEGHGSIAVKTDEAGRVTHASHFTASENERKRAAGEDLRRDPMHSIKPGTPWSELERKLVGGGTWARRDVHNTTDEGWTAPDDVVSSADFGRSGTPDDRIRILFRKDGGNVVVHSIGRPGEKPGELVDEGTYQARALAARRAKEEEERQREETRTKGLEKLRAAVEAGDAEAMTRELSGMSINDAVNTLRREFGYENRGNRRSTVQGERKITYTLRAPDGSTVQVRGPRFYGGGVDRVKIEKPHSNARERLPRGQMPKNARELYSDAIGRAEEIAARHGAKVNITGINVGRVQRNALAHHEFNGAIAIRKHLHDKIEGYLKRRHAGETLSDRDHMAFYEAVQVLHHETNHGIGKAGDAPRGYGMAFGPNDYSGHGKTLEEALTEETSHHETADWLREMGMTDVLGAVKRSPRHGDVLGTYRKYRVQLRQVFDEAGVPQEERLPLMQRMKYGMSHPERMAEIERRVGRSAHAALFARPKERVKEELDFTPIAPVVDALGDVKAYEAGHDVREGDVVGFRASGGISGRGSVAKVTDTHVHVRVREGSSDTHEISRAGITDVERPSVALPHRGGKRVHVGDRVLVHTPGQASTSARDASWGRLESVETGTRESRTLMVVLDDGRTVHVRPQAVETWKSPLDTPKAKLNNGRTVGVGDTVTTTSEFFGDQPGVVHDVSDENLRVLSDDGLLLWKPRGRIK